MISNVGEAFWGAIDGMHGYERVYKLYWNGTVDVEGLQIH
jgi:hypothetical protein